MLWHRIDNIVDIKLSLKATKCALTHQIKHSRLWYPNASDVEESEEFIANLEKVLENMENLFGDLLESRPMTIEIRYGEE